MHEAGTKPDTGGLSSTTQDGYPNFVYEHTVEDDKEEEKSDANFGKQFSLQMYSTVQCSLNHLNSAWYRSYCTNEATLQR